MLVPAVLACLLQATWVVDDNGGPGVDFFDLPPAVAAAADGDLILVRAGTYTHFTLAGKGLRILGEDAATTFVSYPGPTGVSRSSISGVPSTSLAYVDRMTFDGSGQIGTRLAVSGSSTRVVLADLVVVGANVPLGLCGLNCGLGGCAALSVSGSLAHVLRSALTASSGGCGTVCTLVAGGDGLGIAGGARVHAASTLVGGGSGGVCIFAGGPTVTSAGAGVRVVGSAATPTFAWIADAIVDGGDVACPSGLFAPTWIPASGLYATDATVRVSGDATSEIHGGDGGGYSATSTSAAAPAITTLGSATVVGHSSPVTGGVSTCYAPVTAPPTTGPGITLTATPLPVLRVSGSLTTSGSATVSLTNGPAGVPFLIAVAFGPGYADGGALFVGEILVDPVQWFPLFGGALSAAGDVSVTVPLAGVAPGFVHTPLLLQGIALDPGGSFWRVSNATVATIRP